MEKPLEWSEAFINISNCALRNTDSAGLSTLLCPKVFFADQNT
jgi:hypothetical protein